jgi:hypothetical protein
MLEIRPFADDGEISINIGRARYSCEVKERTSALDRLKSINSKMVRNAVDAAVEDLKDAQERLRLLKEMIK